MKQKSESSWGDIKAIAALTGPILITQYAQIANGVVDTIMCGNFSPESLAGIGLGVAVWVPMQAFLIGVLYGLLVKLAQLCGSGNETEIPQTTQQAVWLGLFLAGVMTGGIYFLSEHLSIFGLQPELLPVTQDYLWGLAWAFPVTGFFYSLRFFCEGQGVPRVITMIALGAVALNIVLNYALIFGNLGFPSLGARGCGIATGLSWIASSVAVLCYVSLAPRFARSRPFRSFYAPDIMKIGALFKIGLPIGIAFLSEYLVMACIAIMIGHLDMIAVAGHQITYNVSMVLFSLPVALSIAISIVVGQARGAQNRAREQRMVVAGLRMAALTGLALTVLLLCTAKFIPSVYTDDPAVLMLTGSLLLIAAFFQLTDSIQVSLAGALRGVHDTSMPLVITAACHWGVGIPLGFLLSGQFVIKGLEDVLPVMGVQGWWVGLIVSVSLAAVFLGLRARKAFWGEPEAWVEATTETVSEAS